MAELRENGPYIWLTWLTRLLVGENSCGWAAWFRAQHESGIWSRVPSPFDVGGWHMDHTSGVNESRRRWEEAGYEVFTEDQNAFALKGRAATLGGKPDLIARRGNRGFIIDVKTGCPSPSHVFQVMPYMYVAPKAMERNQGVNFEGRVAYGDHDVDIPASVVDERFIRDVSALVRRISAAEPARRVSSQRECGFCDISSVDCPERVAGGAVAEGMAEDL